MLPLLYNFQIDFSICRLREINKFLMHYELDWICIDAITTTKICTSLYSDFLNIPSLIR